MVKLQIWMRIYSVVIFCNWINSVKGGFYWIEIISLHNKVLWLTITFLSLQEKDSKASSGALKKTSRYRNRSLSASSTDSYSSGGPIDLILNILWKKFVPLCLANLSVQIFIEYYVFCDSQVLFVNWQWNL